VWDLNFHVLFDSNLTAQSVAFTGFGIADVCSLGGQDLTAARQDSDFALSTGSATAASARYENTVVGQASEKFSAYRYGDCRTIIDNEFHIASGNQYLFGSQDNNDQGQHDSREKKDAD